MTWKKPLSKTEKVKLQRYPNERNAATSNAVCRRAAHTGKSRVCFVHGTRPNTPPTRETWSRMQRKFKEHALMNIMKTVAAFALALLATPMLHAGISFPAAGSLGLNATTHRPAGSASNTQSQKTIKDPGEYNAYITALNMTDPAAKGAAMEAFVRQYPASILKIDALEQAMAAYQQAGNGAKVADTAKRILAMDANNVRALAIVAFIDRALATQGQAAALQEGCADAQKGLQALRSWQKPESLTDADFEKLRNQMADIFNGTAGFCALQAKNYPQARDFLANAFQIDPTNLQDVYQLAVAHLQMNPMDLNGFWYAAKAVNLAQGQGNAAAQKAIQDYAKAQYTRYHGGEGGWDQIVSAAANQSAPPAGFAQSIKPKPTLAEIAVQALKENDPATLSFSDYEFILSYRDASPANKEAAEKVWNTIVDKEKQGKAKLRIPVKVISSTRFTIDAAITDENQKDSKVDLFVILDDPLDPPLIAGSMVDVVGVLTEYQPDPIRFTMRQAQLVRPPK
jgi:hypothetical protein